MENISISFILDGVIVVLLIATIIYAARLSLYLKKFKDSRSELESVIKDLSVHIDKADKAVSILNRAVEETHTELETKMQTATSMFDDLDMVVKTGDSLANRLEELAVRNRRITQGGDSDLEDLVKKTKATDYDERLETVIKKTKASPFSIRDPELEKGEMSDNGGFTLDDNEVLSEAERDLYEALQNKDKKRGQV